MTHYNCLDCHAYARNDDRIAYFFPIEAAVFLAVLLCALFFTAPSFAASPIPRVIIALYDAKETPQYKDSNIHTMAEMPLNYLGLIVEYHDINAPLPAIKDRQDVRGIITWFDGSTHITDPEAYIKWAAEAVDHGKKFVFIENPGISENASHVQTPMTSINDFLQLFGVTSTRYWISLPYDAEITVHNPMMMNPRLSFRNVHAGYEQRTAISDDIAVHLSAKKPRAESDSVLMATNSHGGYIAEGYVYISHDGENGQIRQWLINPFEFFRASFATDDLPKPDTATLAGRRIFYSHIDGDGFNNYAVLDAYKGKPVIAGQVIMDKIMKDYPDFPVTAAMIGADIDPKWAAVKESRDVARSIFELPNVEMGSHTYSHPFSWEYFADGNWRKEEETLSFYPGSTWKKDGSFHYFSSMVHPKNKNDLVYKTEDFPRDYDIPRAYATEPFDIHKEIGGSINEINTLAPAGKKTEIITWSGNCEPFEQALSLAHDAGVKNINAGESRFDSDNPSYASVAPMSIIVGKYRQIYASTSNEVTYMNPKKNNFFGFMYLYVTNNNTETPLRIKPYGLYYHFFSGEDQASLTALLVNMAYARTLTLTPITASHFTNIIDGFFSTQISRESDNSWHIANRGDMQTIRFDHAMDKSVDFEKSRGIIGQNYHQGSLYVYLDSMVDDPVITLKINNTWQKMPDAERAYLIDSRWPISHLVTQGNEIKYSAGGFGAGEMRWEVPQNGRYKIAAGDEHQEVSVSDHELHFTLPPSIPFEDVVIRREM